MPLIPLFVQVEVDAGDDPDFLSAFNFCNPFDAVLPFSTGTTSLLDMQHLWGLSTFLVSSGTAPGYTPAAASPDDIGRALRFRACLWPFALALLACL